MNENKLLKASGKKASFSYAKLRNSLEKAGADEQNISEIISVIKNQYVEGMSTKKIYQKAYSMLKKISKPVASRYKLKRAIMELGPTGQPFEILIGEIFKEWGYEVEVAKVLDGFCITHEVDVVARKGNEEVICECKFHNNAGYKTDVKTPLYFHSRFNDIVRKKRKDEANKDIKYQGWLLTNAKFTGDAKRYANCYGIPLLGWEHPGNQSLRDIIFQTGLFPITCLASLSKNEKKYLIEKKYILCRDINGKEDVLSDIGVTFRRMKGVLKECEELMVNGILQ